MWSIILKHQWLWWEALPYTPSDNSNYWVRNDRNPKILESMSYEKLILLWFTPVKEPTNDWINQMLDYYFCNRDCNSEEEARAKLTKLIEKHMPKITCYDLSMVWQVQWKFERWEVFYEKESLEELLKSKGLLE